MCRHAQYEGHLPHRLPVQAVGNPGILQYQKIHPRVRDEMQQNQESGRE